MKFQKTLVLPIAVLLVVGAAGAVLATSGAPAGGDGGTVIPAAESASPSLPAGTTTEPLLKDTVLSDVLDDLVTKGTITEAQKTAILDALTAEREARRAERDAARQQLQDFLADGQITQDELDQLPEDSRLRELTELMDDGKITTDELRGLGRGFGHGFGFGGGRGDHDGPWGMPDADASASPTTGS